MVPSTSWDPSLVRSPCSDTAEHNLDTAVSLKSRKNRSPRCIRRRSGFNCPCWFPSVVHASFWTRKRFVNQSMSLMKDGSVSLRCVRVQQTSLLLQVSTVMYGECLQDSLGPVHLGLGPSSWLLCRFVKKTFLALECGLCFGFTNAGHFNTLHRWILPWWGGCLFQLYLEVWSSSVLK